MESNVLDLHGLLGLPLLVWGPRSQCVLRSQKVYTIFAWLSFHRSMVLTRHS